MNKEDIHLEDIGRILLGQTPPLFLLEVLLRTLIVYTGLLLAIRVLGKRTNGELTIIEQSIIIMLGAIVSVPMQVPDRGILQGFLVLLCIVCFQRGLTWLMFRSEKIERLTQGRLCMLVKDGVLQLDMMKRTRISRQQVFTVIRTRNIYHLGKVCRLYLESCGSFSLYQAANPRPGLPVFPPDDDRILQARKTAQDGTIVCCNCGTAGRSNSRHAPCTACGMTEWTDAMI